MSAPGLLQLVLLIVALGATIGPFGRYMAKVYGSDPTRRAPGDRIFLPIERAVYRVCRVDPDREQRWNVYTLSLIAFSFMSVMALYAMLRLQDVLPFNPNSRPGMNPWQAFNSSVSFVTNTNWQWFSGEQAISHFNQMVGFTVQNFVSASVGMAVAIAFVRGIWRRGRSTIIGRARAGPAGIRKPRTASARGAPTRACRCLRPARRAPS